MTCFSDSVIFFCVMLRFVLYLRVNLSGLIMKNIFTFIALSLAMSAYAGAEIPAGYYDSLEGKSGSALWNAVKEAGKKNHRTISYGDATWRAFEKTDVRVVNGKECWWDMYSSNNVSVSSGHPGMNIEHSVANSWWDGTKNDAYKDIVHLNPSDATANNRKGNYPLGIVGSITFENGVTFVGKPASGYGGGAPYVYEPCDEYKGDFARVFMYMFVIYDDINWGTRFDWMYDISSDLMLQPWAYKMLLEWNATDGVSQKEVNRNNGIAETQGNRNPFIDLPDLADYIWGAKRGETYHVDGTHQPTDPDPEKPDQPVDPTPDDPVETTATYQLVESAADLISGERYVIVSDGETHYALADNMKGAVFSCTDEIDVTDGKITTLPSDAAIVTITGERDTYTLRMSDQKGNWLGYISSTTNKKMSLLQSPAEGTAVSIRINADCTATMNFGDKVGNFMYNSNSPRFTTYTSEQTPVSLYRYIQPIHTGIQDVENIDDSALVEVWGNNIIAPEGTRIFDINGCIVDGRNLEKGIYIVTKDTFSESVKIMIR